MKENGDHSHQAIFSVNNSSLYGIRNHSGPMFLQCFFGASGALQPLVRHQFRHSAKHLIWDSTKWRKSYRFETTQGSL